MDQIQARHDVDVGILSIASLRKINAVQVTPTFSAVKSSHSETTDLRDHSYIFSKYDANESKNNRNRLGLEWAEYNS